MSVVGDSLLGSSFYREGTLSLASPETSLGFEGRRAYAAVVSRLTGREAPSVVGRYRLVRLIGQGAFGSVYEAHDPRLERRVAIKIVDSTCCQRDPYARARLIREAQALARLRHPNVVQIFDVGTFEGPEGEDVYIVMELLEGPTLREWIADERPSRARIVEAFRAAGHALEAAHALGVVHRDFKPCNVMFDVDNVVKVVDFGLASVRRRPDAIEESTERMA
ncbi:MAG: serine/threonine-protein kinase, partial [Myxococcota bacterium]